MTDGVSTKIEKFFSSYRLKKYSKREVLILNGDAPDSVYYLVSGKVKQYDITDKGDEVILNVFKPGAFFPMSLAINPMPSPYIFEAETDIEIRQAPAQEVVAFLQANPDVMYDLLARLYRGIDGVLGRMAQLMSSNARSRLVYELLLEARRFGSAEPDGSQTLKITEKDLAARTGLTRETVSRELNKLKKDSLISTGSRTIKLENPGKLEALLRS